MAVVVDPRGLNLHHRGDEGGEEQRFEVAALEHARRLRCRARLRPTCPAWAVHGRATCRTPDLSPLPVAAAVVRELIDWNWYAAHREPELAAAPRRAGVRAAGQHSRRIRRRPATVWLAVTGSAAPARPSLLPA